MNKTPDGMQKPDLQGVLRAERAGPGKWLKRTAGYAALAVILGWAGWYYFGSDTPQSRTQYVTFPVSRSDLVVRVTATGSIQPTNKVDISSEMSGVIRAVKVDFNSSVKVGDVMAELDRSKLEASVAAARARLAVTLAVVQQAIVSLDETRLALERKQKLAQNKHASQQDLEVAKAAYDRAGATLLSARASVDQAKAELALAETNLDRTRIVSPINGVVLMRKADPGQTVASSLQAPVLFTIAEDLRKVEVQVDIDEADVGKVHDGMKASFSVDAYPRRRFDAVLKTVRYGPEVVQGVVTYKGILNTDNNDLLLRPGMTATAEIIVQNIQKALTIPNQALRFSPTQRANGSNGSFLQRILPGRPRFREPSRQQANGPNRQIWVLRNDTPVRVTVTVGATDGRRTEIRSGDLGDNDAVIVDTETAKR